MISIWHLLWIIPLSVFFGMMIMGLFVATEDEDDYLIDNSDGHMICRYSGEPCSKEILNIYEDNCKDCVDKPFDGEFPDWCKEERKRSEKL